MKKAASQGGLLIGSAVFPVDEVELRTGWTCNRLTEPLTLFDLLLREISLHIHAGVWTSKDEEISHRVSLGLGRQHDLDADPIWPLNAQRRPSGI
jgi:hypothetical protein